MSGYRGKTCAESIEELRRSVQKLNQEIFKLTVKQHLFNKTMKVCKDKVLDLYKSEGAEGKALLEKVFGKEVFAGRPEGTGVTADYFPAYEIVMDELRDYRFYAEDMCHPSSQTVDYIRERFLTWALPPEEHQLLEENIRSFKHYHHRPH